jgi:hypothetical protein
LAYRRPGHPWEVAVITQGLLLWPYFTFARLIAPYVVDGKGQEYKPDAAMAILVLLIVSLLLSVMQVRRCSTTGRRILTEMVVVIGAIGVVERLYATSFVVSVVR